MHHAQQNVYPMVGTSGRATSSRNSPKAPSTESTLLTPVGAVSRPAGSGFGTQSTVSKQAQVGG